MLHRLQRHAAWFTGWLLISLLGTLVAAQLELTRMREGFEADTRTALRLLNQRVSQHDAMLSTLTYLRPGSEPGRPEQRLPSIYADVLAVQRRAGEEAWPNALLPAAELESRRLRRAVLTDVNFDKGRYQLVLGAEPASYALLIDVRSMIPWNEWPMPPDASPVRMSLNYAGQSYVLQPGAMRNGGTEGWIFEFRRLLAPDSQPFELVAERRVGWGELPWSVSLSWSLLVAVLMLTTRALLRQRKDRRRAEELLRMGQVARLNTLGELAAGMAHELNEPLAAVLINAQVANRVLGQETPDLLTAQLAVKEAVAQAQRASDVVKRLRHAVAQPDLGARIQAIDLLQLTRKALSLLDPELRRRSVEPEVELNGPAFKVRGDPVALEQIVHNLLLNALQALDQVPVGERRLIATLDTEGMLGRLSLRDSGPGMRADVMPHVFEPFYTTREGGLGLGLSLSESLARGMGGTLSASNRSPRGANFTLSLPLASLQ